MIRVLIAEDESIARNGNDIELTAAAENGMEACLMAREFTPDIIITDIGLVQEPFRMWAKAHKFLNKSGKMLCILLFLAEVVQKLRFLNNSIVCR
jgi:DNA-binding NarL/FixJ family response regulator